MKTPSVDDAAAATANYLTAEFADFEIGDERAIARRLLSQPEFICTAEYAIGRVMKIIAYNKQMQAYGPTRVVGQLLGEWAWGKQSIDEQLDTW